MKKTLPLLSIIFLSTIISTNIIACNAINKNSIFNKPIKKQFTAQQPPKNSNWKLLIEGKNEEINYTLKTYIGLKLIGKIWFVNTWKGKQLKTDSWKIFGYKDIYRWDGANKPQKPIINRNTGEITNWNEKKIY